MHHTPGESALTQAPGRLSYSEFGREKTQAQPRLCLWGVPKNLSGVDLGTAHNPGPALVPWQSNMEPEQCRLRKHTRREWGQT